MNTQTQVVMDNAAAIAKSKEERTALAVKLADAGLTDAKTLQSVITEAGVTLATKAREILVARAKEFQGDESRIRDYLSGFRKGFEKSGDTRASEAGVIMRAYAKDSQKIENHTGGMAGLIEVARSIAGKQNGTSQRSGGTKAPTDKGMDSINGRIKAMKPAQAVAVAQNAIAQIVATNPKDWELHLLRQIDGLTVKLAQSKQPVYQILAEDLQKACAEVLNQDAIDNALHQEAKDNTGTTTEVQTPAPASWAEPLAEVQQQVAA